MLGAYLTSLRNEARLTQSIIAESLHVSRQTVSAWETGLARITAGDLDRYLDCVFATVWERDRALQLAGEPNPRPGQDVTAWPKPIGPSDE
jgi:transcriptional regulator with XRE-family HTH domain